MSCPPVGRDRLGDASSALPEVSSWGKTSGALTHGKRSKPVIRVRASCRDRTDDLPLTRRPLWPSELRRHVLFCYENNRGTMNSITSASTAVNLALRVETRRLPVRGYSPVVTGIGPLAPMDGILPATPTSLSFRPIDSNRPSLTVVWAVVSWSISQYLPLMITVGVVMLPL